MGQFSHGSLTKLLSENVVELVFIRRSGNGLRKKTRRMLCTNNALLLNSIPGKIALGFKPPKGVGLPYDPKAKNLVVTYDLMWQSYRQISLENVNVVSAIPLKTNEEIDNFWEFFSRKLVDMSGSEKEAFMRK